MRPLLALIALAIPTLAPAASIRDCDSYEANARNIVLPPSAGIATYANGAVTIIGLDTGGEPACCSSHLMVLYPEPGEPFHACALISREGTSGWSGIDVGRAVSAYDPATGLRVSVPVGIYDGTDSQPGTLSVTVNQATGQVTAE